MMSRIIMDNFYFAMSINQLTSGIQETLEGSIKPQKGFILLDLILGNQQPVPDDLWGLDSTQVNILDHLELNN